MPHPEPKTPGELAQAWLAELRALPACGAVPPTPPEAQRRLALPGRLRRCRPELLADDLATLLDYSDRETPDLIPTCAAAFVQDAWLTDAQALANSWAEPVADEAVQAVRLLQALDDADLALRQARRCGSADPTWDQATAACLAWLDTHAVCLLPAAPWAALVAGTFRPDLAEAVPDLAPTVRPFRLLLDEAAHADEEVGYRPGRPDPALADALDRVPRRRWRSFERDRLPRVGSAAAAAEPPPPRVLTWVSPGDLYEALLALPMVADPSSHLRLNVYDTEGRPALALAGQAVRLAGHLTRLNDSASAEFTLEALGEDGDLLLEVGPGLTVWDALDDTAE